MMFFFFQDLDHELTNPLWNRSLAEQFNGMGTDRDSENSELMSILRAAAAVAMQHLYPWQHSVQLGYQSLWIRLALGSAY